VRSAKGEAFGFVEEVFTGDVPADLADAAKKEN